MNSRKITPIELIIIFLYCIITLMTQNREVHYRFPVEDKITLLNKINEVANKEQERTYQSNVTFDNSKKEVSLSGGKIRLKILGDSGKKILAYHKADEDGANVEHKINFHDAEHQIEKILEVMGFIPSDGHEKFDTKWAIEGISISFDEYPFADFLEIDGGEDKVNALIEEFGFTPKDNVDEPVDSLFDEWREEKGLSKKDYMRFEDFDK